MCFKWTIHSALHQLKYVLGARSDPWPTTCFVSIRRWKLAGLNISSMHMHIWEAVKYSCVSGSVFNRLSCRRSSTVIYVRHLQEIIWILPSIHPTTYKNLPFACFFFIHLFNFLEWRISKIGILGVGVSNKLKQFLTAAGGAKHNLNQGFPILGHQVFFNGVM